MYIDLSKIKSGFCDRLRQITFCIALEKLKKSKVKKIEIFEIKTNECPYYFTDLMNIKGIKIINLQKCKKIKTIQMDPFNSQISLKTCIKFNNEKEIDNNKLLQEWKDTYKTLEPKKKYINRINSIIKNKKITCVHLRMTDKLVNFLDYMIEIPSKDVIYKKQIADFFRDIIKIIPKKTKNIYIAADEKSYRDKIISHLKNHYKIINKKIVFNKKKLRQTSGADFIMDLFVMSKSELIISTTGGNVPLTAILMSKKENEYIKWSSFKLIYKIFNSFRLIIYKSRKLLSFNYS